MEKHTLFSFLCWEKALTANKSIKNAERDKLRVKGDKVEFIYLDLKKASLEFCAKGMPDVQ